jgi:hypothetical protein
MLFLKIVFLMTHPAIFWYLKRLITDCNLDIIEQLRWHLHKGIRVVSCLFFGGGKLRKLSTFLARLSLLLSSAEKKCSTMAFECDKMFGLKMDLSRCHTFSAKIFFEL